MSYLLGLFGLGILGLIFWGSVGMWVEARAEADVAESNLLSEKHKRELQKQLDEKLHQKEILLDSLPASAHRERLRAKLRKATAGFMQ